MTTYSSNVAGLDVKYNRAKYKPHDKLNVRVVKATINTANGPIPSGQTINVITLPANVLVLGGALRVAADSAENMGFDIGLAGGSTFTSDTNTQVAAVTVFNAQIMPYFSNITNKVTITANGAASSAATGELWVAYIETDSMNASN